MSRSRDGAGARIECSADVELVRCARCMPGDRHHRPTASSTSPAWLPPMAGAAGRRVLAGGQSAAHPRSICFISPCRPLVLELSSFHSGNNHVAEFFGAVVRSRDRVDSHDRYANGPDYAAPKEGGFARLGNGVRTPTTPLVMHGEGRRSEGGASQDRRPCSAAGRDLLHAAHRCGYCLPA